MGCRLAEITLTAETQIPRRRRRLAQLLWGLTLCLFAMIYLGLLAVVADFIGVDSADLIPGRLVALVWPAAGSALILSSLAGPGLWWVFAGRRLLGPRMAGVVRLWAAAFALVGMAVGGVELMGTDVAVAGAAVTAKWAYSVRIDPMANRLVIKGRIGPRFGAAVERGLAGLVDPVSVEIDSPGGLVNEAMRAAKAIGARPGARVVARHWCASACMIVLMSGEQRLADRRALVAFHASAPLVGLRDPLMAWSFARQRRVAETYLVRRGAPSDLVARADRLGPGRVVMLTAAQALDRGVLTGLSPAQRPRRHVRVRSAPLDL